MSSAASKAPASIVKVTALNVGVCAEHEWPPPIEVPLTWRTELESRAAWQDLLFTTADAIAADFTRIYEVVRA
jgi:hypothetical protein